MWQRDRQRDSAVLDPAARGRAAPIASHWSRSASGHRVEHIASAVLPFCDVGLDEVASTPFSCAAENKPATETLRRPGEAHPACDRRGASADPAQGFTRRNDGGATGGGRRLTPQQNTGSLARGSPQVLGEARVGGSGDVALACRTAAAKPAFARVRPGLGSGVQQIESMRLVENEAAAMFQPPITTA